MKKIILAIALCGFAFSQVNAQNPATVVGKKTTPTGVQATDPKMSAPQATPAAAVKPEAKPVTPKVAPASTPQSKSAMHKKRAHVKHVAKENKDAAKPLAPGDNTKK